MSLVVLIQVIVSSVSNTPSQTHLSWDIPEGEQQMTN